MISVLVVSKADVLEIYKGKQLPLRGSNGVVRRESGLLVDNDIPVLMVEDLDPYAMVRIRHMELEPNNTIIVPKSLLRIIEVPNAIDAFTPILNRLHPNCWYHEAGMVYIHYPELRITNTLGLKHTITNLIVRFVLGNNYALGGSLEGARLTFTQRELSAGYIHSHLHIGSYDFNSFCRGTGSTADKMLLHMNKFNTPDQFELFLVQLKTYLEWESLEGTPYISITSLQGASEDTQTNSLGGSAINSEAIKEIVRLLAHPDNHKYLTTVGKFRLLVPSDDLFEFEKLWPDLPDANYYYGMYDKESCRYMRVDAEVASDADFGTLSIPRGIASKFGVTPKILPEPEGSTDTSLKLERRLYPGALRDTIATVNKYLMDGLKMNINERNES